MRITHKKSLMQSESPLRWVRRHVFRATQDEIAAIGGVSRPRVSRYETERDPPPFAFLTRLREEALRRGVAFSGDWFFALPPHAAGAPEPAAQEPQP